MLFSVKMGVKFFYDLVIIHTNLAELGVKSGQSGGKFHGPAILFNDPKCRIEDPCLDELSLRKET